MKEDILDRYALQILSDADKIWLQKALKADPSFQKELDLHLEIVRGIEMHTEKLFDVAFAELHAIADETLKNNIDEVDKSLKLEGFFETISFNQPIIDKKLPLQEKQIKEQPIALEQKTNIAEKTTPTNSKEKVSQMLPQLQFSSMSTSSSEQIKTPTKTDWGKTAAILLVIILAILLLWQFL